MDGSAPVHRLSSEATSRSQSSSEFREKSPDVQEHINEALDILAAFGIPMDSTGRQRELMAGAFAAVAAVPPGTAWSETKDASEHTLATRRILAWRNEHLEEDTSPGSYDDVRRKSLKMPVVAGIVVNSLPGSAHNDGTRGYGLHPEFAAAARAYGMPGWEAAVQDVMSRHEALREQLDSSRQMTRVQIALGDGVELDFGPGKHNELQRAVVEEFLPRFGHGARVLYLGDAEDKDAHLDEAGLTELGFFELSHEELPDVVAYSDTRSWLYVIEAVATSGPVDTLRHIRLRELLKGVDSGVVYVTAFLDRGDVFRRFMPEIAWETEVWVASEPDHLIHFNGDRFLGPHDDD